jgi:UDP-galactopyranose mutase
MKALLVFSHLRWDFVYQRPQHVLSRLARHWRVIYVEEPMHRPGNPTTEIKQVAPGLEVVRFHTPSTAPGFHDEQLPVLRNLLQHVLADLALADYGVWFYTPMALPLLTDLQPVAIYYDCMDELSAFRNSPKQLVQRETALLRVANVVFTGGPSLYRHKRASNPHTHCIPSSVDSDHFRRGRDTSQASAAFAQLPRPRLGFYGVIDERFDIELLAGIATLRPDWQFCMVGPIVKIDPAALPRLPNIHYLPQQPYEELPALLAAWDVCLLPFARNESTRFISPTKTLEYLAAGKPVVSTSITDVRELYDSAVSFADSPADFVAACEALLNEDADSRARREIASDALVAATSWNVAAEDIRQALAKATETGLTPATALLFAPTEPAPHKPMSRAECLIVGAGPTGLSAAYHYGRDATLLEANEAVGGWCRSIKDNGFTFDHAGHIMFSNSEVVQDLYRVLLGDNVLWQDREAWIYSKNTYTRYPFQGALYGLPPTVLKDCIMGAIEARYGLAAAVCGPAANAMVHEDCCADGTALEAGRATIGATTRAEPANFEEFIYRTWGRGIAEHFAIPYNRKLWSYPLREMETSWLGGRVPLPDLEQMIEGALSPVPRPMGPNARFGYPLRGGFQAMMDGFVPLLRGKLHLRSRVRRVRPSRHEVELDDGRVFPYDALISTMPLPALISAIGAEAPVIVREAAAKLRRVSVRCVNLGIGRGNLTEKHWIYYPEDTIFHRVFVQGNASPYCNAPGGFGLTCEISYSSVKPLPLSGQALIDRCIADCIRVGLFHPDDPVWAANEVDMPYAYVLYDHARADAVRTIRTWLDARDITLAGRYSEWEYYNSDHAFLAGKAAAEAVKAATLADAGAKLA